MLRQALVDRTEPTHGDFRLRGKDVSRIEGFSDAAFAFAITLLVVSLEVPRSFDQLLDVMKGIPAFAVCFAILAWLWGGHYKFFRRYGLSDGLTIALNCMLLFLVMLYVYPLKFVFTIFMGMITGLKPSTAGTLRQDQVDDLFVVYGVGFTLVFLVLGLMNLNAWRLRERLGPNDIEKLMTRQEIARCGGLMLVGLASMVTAILLPSGWAGMAGMLYGFIAAVEFMIGARYSGKVDARCAAAMADAAT